MTAGICGLFAVPSRSGRSWRDRRFQPKAAFSHFPPVPRVDVEGQQRGRGCAKTRREIPYGRSAREFSQFFSLCDAIGLETWRWLWPPQSFRTASVDLTRSRSLRRMTGICAKRPPADWVLTLARSIKRVRRVDRITVKSGIVDIPSRIPGCFMVVATRAQRLQRARRSIVSEYGDCDFALR